MWRVRETGANTWRGSVHNVATGRRFYITHVGEIADFVGASLLNAADDDGTQDGTQR